MKRTLVLISAGLALTAAACGGGGGKSATTTLLGEGQEIGADLTTPTSRPAVATTVAAATTAPAPRCPFSDPVSEIEYGKRLRLTLTVSALCPSRAADIALTLKVTNISSEPVHYDRNQSHFFSLLANPPGSGRIRWEDTHCDPPPRDRNETAGTLAPGQAVTFDGLYPAPKSVSDREKCRRLEVGGYSANAVFLVCDAGSYADGYCDISKDTQYTAEPVLIDVRA